MKKRLSFRIFTAVTLVLLVLFSAGCTTAPVPRESGVAYELTVLHTNDHHGTVLAKDGVAGLAERATFIATVREENPNVLVLDAGDINTGSALSNMFSAEPDIMGYNLIGYDAVAFGNHEFDKDLSTLKKQMEQAQFTWISANIKQGSS